MAPRPTHRARQPSTSAESLHVAELGAPLVVFSTDYVFDGRKRTPYVESDAPNPRSVYGSTKLHGEAAAGERAWIVRSSWLYGPTGHNFLRTMLRLGSERDEVAVVDDQRGCPTYVGHLAAATKELVGQGAAFGIWHLAAEGDCTWADFAEALFAEAGIDCRVRRIATAELERPASRPMYSVLRSERHGRPCAAALAGGLARLPGATRRLTRVSESRAWGILDPVGRNVLVVSTVDDAESVLRERIGGDVDLLKVVVPVVRQGFLDWLANDERAFSHAEEEAERLAAELPGGTTDARAGEADVMLAIQDALAEFPADEIVVALHPEDEAEFAERVASADVRASVGGVPVRVLVARDDLASYPSRCACSSPAAPGSSARTSSGASLAAGDEVVVLDKLTYAGNPANLDGVDVHLAVGDIADADAVARAGRGCDAVVNFAAETHVDRSILTPRDFVHTDVVGTQVLLEWARDEDARYVQVSTDEVYGDLQSGGRSREDDPLRPSSPYSASKAGGDLQVLAYVRTYGVNASITRGANTYGPNQYPEKLIPLFTTNALDGVALPLYGDGKQVREWLHAEDHCAAVELVMRAGAPGEVYNVGGEEHENIEVTHRILELTGGDPSLIRHVEDRAGHDRRYALDDARLRELGWAPEHSFGERGLQETVAWYRENRAWWEPIKTGEYRAYYEAQYAERLKA